MQGRAITTVETPVVLGYSFVYDLAVDQAALAGTAEMVVLLRETLFAIGHGQRRIVKLTQSLKRGVETHDGYDVRASGCPGAVLLAAFLARAVVLRIRSAPNTSSNPQEIRLKPIRANRF